MNVVSLLVQTAARLPQKIAMVYKNQPISYRELNEQIFKLANGLRAQGIKEDMNVGLMLTNRSE